MVHKFYFYDSRVGMAKTLECEYCFDDVKLFDDALLNFEHALVFVLQGRKYMFLTPSDAFEDNEGFTNVVIEGDNYLTSCVADFAIAFFKVREFILR